MSLNRIITDLSELTGSIATSQVTGLDNALLAKAPLASPPFTGTPTAPTATAGTSTPQLATTAFVAAGLALKAPADLPTFTGASSPQVLILSTSAAASPAFEFRDAAGTPNRWWFGSGVSSATDGRFFIFDRRQSVTRLVIDTTGFVGYGVGNSAPLAPLHVKNGTGPQILIESTVTTTSPAFELRDASGTPNRWWIGSGASSGNDGKFFVFDARQGLTRLVIDTAGAVSVPGTLVVGGGTALSKVLSATATLAFPSTAAQASSDLTISLTGAVVGDAVFLGIPASPDANTGFTAWVSAVDTVKVRFHNYSSAPVTPASGTYRPAIIRF